jgi:hypothetical protein
MQDKRRLGQSTGPSGRLFADNAAEKQRQEGTQMAGFLFF